MSDLQAMTALTNDDKLDAQLRVVDVKPSDHKHYGRHDLITVELAEQAGDLPAGLRFTVRRPHDGSTDLRSDARKEKTAHRATVGLPEPTPAMSKAELVALADAHGIDLPTKATKAQIGELITG